MAIVATRGRLTAAILTAVVATTVAAPAAAKNAPLGEGWVSLGSNKLFNLDFDDSNLSEIGLERTADDVLHVAWTHDVSGFGKSVLVSRLTGTDPDKAPKFEKVTETIVNTTPEQGSSLNESVDLVGTPEGGLRVFFAGLFPGRPYDGVMASAATPPGSTAFGNPVPAAASATAPPSPVYAASGIAAALGGGGTFVSAWGDSSPSGGGFHVGLDPAVADSPFSDACCEIDPAVAVDSSTGETIVAANLIDQGIRVRSLDGGQSHVVPGSTAAWKQQRTSISGRIGAPGVWIAYGTGENMFDAKPALWEIGAPKFRFFKNQAGAANVGMAPAPGGRLWIYWERNGRVFASRTDPEAKTFGSVVGLDTHNDSETLYRLIGDGSLGTLDLFALTEQGNHLEWSVERVPPGLKLKAGQAVVKPGGKIGFIVSDAGEPVKGAKVASKLAGQVLSDKTNAAGKATLAIPGGAQKGTETAEVVKDGYARSGNSDRVEKFKVG